MVQGQKRTFAEAYIEKVLYKALKDGDMKAIKLIINYVDGLPKQTIEGAWGFKDTSDEELKERAASLITGIIGNKSGNRKKE